MAMRRAHWLAAGLAVFVSAVAIAPTSASAQDLPRKEDLVKLLSQRVRAMVIDTPAPQGPASRAAPAAESKEKEMLRQMIPMLPEARFNVDFGYKSSSIKPGSEPLLDRLGEALTDPSLKGNRYVIVGHTDAAEGREDDMALSEQRAAAVRDYLVKKFAVPPDRLVSIGFGKGRPREPGNPLSPANRRVEIVNVGE